MTVETEAAPAEITVIPKGRTRKPQNSGERKTRQPKLKAIVEGPEDAPKAQGPTHINGYPIADGFAKIMVFPDPSEGNKTCFFETKLGDHPKTFLAKNRMHVLPMGLINNILDTTQEYPVDDCSDLAHPQRGTEMRARLPHSDPIPATPEEYREYIAKQNTMIHPNKFKKF